MVISVSKDATLVFKATVKLIVVFLYGDLYSDFCALMFYLVLISSSLSAHLFHGDSVETYSQYSVISSDVVPKIEAASPRKAKLLC